MAIRVNHPPVAEAGPEIVTDALYVTLDGSGSSDADGDRLIHTWDFGDGSPPALGETVTHAYPRSGIFPVTLTVDDGTGLGNAVATDSTRVLIDARPMAVAGGNRDVCSGDAILFDGSASGDPDGGLLRYDWDFGDGTRSDIVNPSKTYEQPGIYTVTLTVRDEFGPAASACTATASPRVVREAPIADAGPPLRACTNQTVRLRRLGLVRRRRRGQRLLLELRRRLDRRRRAPDARLRAAGHLHGDPDHHRRRPRRLRRARHRRDHGDRRRGAADRDRRPRPRRRRRRRRLRRGARRRRSTCAARASAGTSATARPATGPTVAHAFAEPGTRTVHAERDASRRQRRLRHHRDPADRRRSTRRRRRSIDAPDRIAAGALVLFDAAASTDPDGAITGFDWDFGDGATATGVQAQHRFADARHLPGQAGGRPTTPASATAASRPSRAVEVTPAARWPA